MSQHEVPAFLIGFLHEVIQAAEALPEHGQEKGVHVYISKLEIVCEGEVIGHLVNDDPEWIYRAVEGA